MEDLAREFQQIAKMHAVDRLKVKFGKPASEEHKVEVFKGDVQRLFMDVDKGEVEDVVYDDDRHDRFDDGKIERITFKTRDLKMKLKDGVWKLDLEVPDNAAFNSLDLNLNPIPGDLSGLALDVRNFLRDDRLAQFDFDKERVEFERMGDGVMITVGKGKKAKEYKF